MPGPDVNTDLTGPPLPQLPLTPDQIETIPATPGPKRLHRLTELVIGGTDPGETRDALLRHLAAGELRTATAALWREPRRPAQTALLAELRTALAPFGGIDGLAAVDRLRCHLVAHGHLDELLTLVRRELDGEPEPEVLVEDGRAYAQYPYFRDSTLRVPDACYDVTAELGVRHRLSEAALDGSGLALAGEARVHRIPGGGSTEVVLRGHVTGTELRFPVTDEGDGRFTGRVPLAGVPEGVWDVHLAVTAGGMEKEARLDAPDGEERCVVADDGTVATLPVADGLTLDVGELRHPVEGRLRVDGAAWDPQAGPATLAVTGRCALAGRPAGSLTLRAAAADGQIVDVPVETGPDGSFSTSFPCTAAGEWLFGLRLAAGGREWSVPVPEQPELAVARWQRLGLPWYAKPLPDRGGVLAVRTGRVEVIKGVRGRLRRR